MSNQANKVINIFLIKSYFKGILISYFLTQFIYIGFCVFYDDDYNNSDFLLQQKKGFLGKFVMSIEKDISLSKFFFPLPITKRWFSLFVYYLSCLFLCSYIQIIMQEIYFRVSFLFLKI